MPLLPSLAGRAALKAVRRSDAALSPGALSAVSRGLSVVAKTLGQEQERRRHPMAPSAVRVERSRGRQGEDTADQYAVTMWFGEGPALPSVAGSHPGMRLAGKVAGAVVAAAAVAAGAAAVARLEQSSRRTRVVEGTARDTVSTDTPEGADPATADATASSDARTTDGADAASDQAAAPPFGGRDVA